MIKLQLINVVDGRERVINADSDVAESNLRHITHIQLKRRGEGVGHGFKGRAPNRAVVYWGDRQWNSVVLPDDYNMDSLKSMTLFDSKKQLDPVTFTPKAGKPLKWEAQQQTTQFQTGTVQAAQSGSTRVYEIEEAFKTHFDWIGGVGVNDLGHALAVTIEVPADANTTDNQNALYEFGDKLSEQYGTTVAVNFTLIGARGTGVKQVLGEGHVGETPFPQHAMAGRQPIQPVGAGVSSPTGPVVGVNPYTPGWQEGGEKTLQPGQTEEPYGSLGPQDGK